MHNPTSSHVRRTTLTCLVLLFLLFVVAGGCTSASPEQTSLARDMGARFALTDHLQRFTHELERLRHELHIPGMSVAVLHNQRVVYTQGFGTANIERGLAATAATPYHIASLTKPFTSIIVLRLVQEGTLDLDNPISYYLPRGNICARIQALNARMTNLIEHAYRCDIHHTTVRHLLSHTAHDTPGTSFEYNGALYSVLEWVINSVSEQGFPELLVQHIIGPLEMRRTTFGGEPDLNPAAWDNLARPYRWSDSRQTLLLQTASVPYLSASDGIISTVQDLARFDIALDQHAIIAADTTRAMFTPTISTRTSEPLPYGLGWFVQDIAQTRYVWHYGWQEDAYSSLYLKVPDHNLTLILLANSDAASGGAGAGPGFGLERGDVHTSPFAAAFAEAFALPWHD